MTAPADALSDLISAATDMLTVDGPEAKTMALTLFTVKLGAALGCSPAEVREQLDLMRPTPEREVRMGGGGRLRGTPKSLDAEVEDLTKHLRLVPVEGSDAHD